MVAFQGDEPVDLIRSESGELTGLEAFLHKHQFSKGIVGSVRDLTEQRPKRLAATALLP